VRLTLDQVTLPNGAQAEFEIVHHPGGAGVVAIDGDDKVCLLRQYRYALGDWLWEIPAGKLDGGEPPLDCARRELAEEAGVTARRWENLGEYLSSPGVLTEIIHVFLARGLEPVPAAPEDHEVLEVEWVGLEKALQMAATGDGLRDGKTLVGLLWAGARLAAESNAGHRPPETDS